MSSRILHKYERDDHRLVVERDPQVDPPPDRNREHISSTTAAQLTPGDRGPAPAATTLVFTRCRHTRGDPVGNWQGDFHGRRVTAV